MHLNLPILIGLMVAALVLAIAAKRIHLPYNVALVVGGMLITLSHLLPDAPHLTPEVVFLLCLPLLLFEGGITADLQSIRKNALPIGLLASVGMIVAIILVHIGYSVAKKPMDNEKKFKRLFWCSFVALCIFVAMIPWEGKQVVGRPNVPAMNAN